MKLALEAPSGLVSKRPDLVVDALAAIAKSEGVDRCTFLDSLAKATGATRAHQHHEGRSPYAVISEASEQANFIYESAMTMALAEIMEMISNHLDEVDVTALSGEASDG